MKRILFDIETNGLYDDVSVIWCIWTVNVDTEEYIGFRPNEIDKALEYLATADELLGHNIMRYDLPVLEKVRGFKFKGRVTDTLVLSQLIWPDLATRDIILRYSLRNKGIIMPNDIIGSHALKAWGYRLGNRKQYHEDWTKFTEEMYSYCRQDVSSNLTLYRKEMEKKYSQRAIDIEHEIHGHFITMEHLGMPFDVQKATKLLSELTARSVELHSQLEKAFPPKIVQLKTKTKTIPFNPGSRTQIGEALLKFKWKPLYNTSGEQWLLGDKPKVDEGAIEQAVGELESVVPEVKLLGEYLMISKRLGQLANGKNAWLKLEKDGVIHGQMNHMGAVTSRCSHMRPNMGQVPAAHSPYGMECRELFYAGHPDYVVVGSDLSGLELRMLAHYMYKWDKGAYGEIILNGDIHSHNQDSAGISTRDLAKKFIYAWLYGAGVRKVAAILGVSKKQAQRVMDKFLKALPALARLKAAVEDAVKKGYLVGLDGRYIPVRSPHAALNTLLQGAGAVVSKYWYCTVWRLIRERNLDASIRLYIHDEVQCIAHKDDVEKLTPIFQEALSIVEKELNINIPLACEFKIGANWKETH